MESEQKLDRLLSVDNADAFRHEGKALFMPPVRKLLDARENPEENRFTVLQLEGLLDALRGQPFTRVDTVVQILCAAHAATKTGMETGTSTGVPRGWAKYSAGDIAEMVHSLDPHRTGMINTRKLLLSLILLECDIVSRDNLVKTLKACTIMANSTGLISEDDFCQIPMWFAQFTQNKNDEDRVIYPRRN